MRRPHSGDLVLFQRVVKPRISPHLFHIKHRDGVYEYVRNNKYDMKIGYIVEIGMYESSMERERRSFPVLKNHLTILKEKTE